MKSGLVAVIALSSLTFAACDGQGVAPGASADPRAFTDADQAKILETLRLSANAGGQVMNECGDLVTPQFLPTELGGSAGTAILFAMGGGPTMASCYGDGPDLHLLKPETGGWREIYSARGRILIILPTATGGVRDIADGGPGFSFPVWSWDGTRYAHAGRDISDAELSKLEATYLP
jgi:hypothetical protein